MKITPTDKQLSDAIAEQIGYVVRHGITIYDGHEIPWTVWDKDDQTSLNPKPLSTDRNLLPEVLQPIWDRKSTFCKNLAEMLGQFEPTQGYKGYIYEILMGFLYCEPRKIVAAVLVTLNKWPSDWQLP